MCLGLPPMVVVVIEAGLPLLGRPRRFACRQSEQATLQVRPKMHVQLMRRTSLQRETLMQVLEELQALERSNRSSW